MVSKGGAFNLGYYYGDFVRFCKGKFEPTCYKVADDGRAYSKCGESFLEMRSDKKNYKLVQPAIWKPYKEDFFTKGNRYRSLSIKESYRDNYIAEDEFRAVRSGGHILSRFNSNYVREEYQEPKGDAFYLGYKVGDKVEFCNEVYTVNEYGHYVNVNMTINFDKVPIYYKLVTEDTKEKEMTSNFVEKTTEVVTKTEVKSGYAIYNCGAEVDIKRIGSKVRITVDDYDFNSKALRQFAHDLVEIAEVLEGEND